MEINGNIVEKTDIRFYQGIAALACRKMKKIDQEQIPTFIVEEALAYYSQFEKYETCQMIKKYFDKHIKFLVSSTREEWFGTVPQKKQSH